MNYRPSPSESQLISLLFIIAGAIMLFFVVSHFALWIFLTVAGFKVLSLGMRMRGMPPLWFWISRWF